MYLLKIILSLFIYLFLTLTYLLVSINFKLKGNVIFFIIISAVIISFIILCSKGLIKKNSKIKLFKKNGGINISTIALFVLISMCFIEYKSFLILKENNENVSVYKIISDFNMSINETNDYNKLFKTIKYDNTTVYFNPKLEPALNLVNAYLKKASSDNAKIFGDITPSPLTIKFDYDKEVFKKRTSNDIDYSGLYSDKDKTIYIYIKDCYSDFLALNNQSSIIEESLLHEYTHHMFFEFMNSNQLSTDKIPIWFMEGISEYIGSEGRVEALPKTLIDFKELNTQKQWISYSNKSSMIYDQSHYAVSQLILMKGKNIIKEILLNTKNTDFNTAFNKATGFTIENYEKNFKEDFKVNWEKYNRTAPIEQPATYTAIKIEGLVKYIKVNPNNINALMDLAQLYENVGKLDNAKSTLKMAVKRKPENNMAWRRLAIIYEDMNDFNNAIKAYEAEASIEEKSVSENPSITYIDLAHVLLLTDIDKAIEFAQKAKKLDKTKFLNKQAQDMIDLKTSIEKGNPYEGCLQFIKSDTLNSTNIKNALIKKMLKDYPSIKCQARSELDAIKNKL